METFIHWRVSTKTRCIYRLCRGKGSFYQLQHPKPFQIELDDELYLKNYHSGGGGPLRRQESDNISLMDELNQSLQKTGSHHTTTLIIGARDWSVQSDRMLSSTAGTLTTGHTLLLYFYKTTIHLIFMLVW